MKDTQIQVVRTSGLLLTAVLLAVCAFVIRSPWNQAEAQVQSEKALQRAQVVGYQIVHLFREAQKESQFQAGGSRSPASAADSSEINNIGTMGLDPWGQPYKYRFLKSDLREVKILVWSAGPNRKVESLELDNEENLIMGQPIYAGDDLGVVIAVQ